MGESRASSVELDRQECVRLLADCRYGRVVLTEHALLHAVPVAFRMDDDGVVVGDNGDGRLAGLTDGSVAAFEADHADTGDGNGWSVLVTAYVSTVTDPVDPSGAATPDSRHRPTQAGRLMRISPAIVTGRSFTLPL